MINKTFPVMSEIIQVRAMAEFIHQNYATLVDNDRAHKHGCALRHLSIQNMRFITTFLTASLSTCFK